MKLKGLCPDNKVPVGLIMKGREALEAEIKDKSGLFKDAKTLDIINERMPTTQELNSMPSSKPTGLKKE